MSSRQDHDGNKCHAWDVCCNSETFKKNVQKSKPFCDMLLSSAIADIKRNFEMPLLDNEYKLLKNKKYMGGKPVPMNLKPDPTKPQQAPPPSESADGKPSASTTAGKMGEAMKAASSGAASKPAVPKGFMAKKEPMGPVTPKYTIVHSGTQELADAWTDGGMTDSLLHAYQNRPKLLVLKIQLPKIENANDVELDIAEKSVILDVGEEPKQLYHLEMTLPYAVDPDGEQSSATFDKSKRTLVVHLPVLPPDEKELHKHQKQEAERIAALQESNLVEDPTPTGLIQELAKPLAPPAPAAEDDEEEESEEHAAAREAAQGRLTQAKEAKEAAENANKEEAAMQKRALEVARRRWKISETRFRCGVASLPPTTASRKTPPRRKTTRLGAKRREWKLISRRKVCLWTTTRRRGSDILL